jgi:hypothetical protein
LSDPNYSTQGKWIYGLVQGANNTVVNIFHTGFQALASILDPVFKGMMPESARNDLSLLQVQDHYLIEQEKLKIERARLRYEISSTEQIIEIRRREVELQEREFNLKNWFFGNKLRLIQECHAESVQLKLQEFQVSWDVYHLPFLLSREETQKLFFQRIDKFWILLAPPKVLCDISDFRSLDTQIEHRLEDLINRYYLSGRIPYPVGCRKIFRESIERIQAIHTRELLSPIPTLVLHSVVTDQEVFITVTCPRSVDTEHHDLSEYQVSLPSWDWELIKDTLELQGQSSRDSVRCIKELIIAFHVVIALYFSDLYCLNLDPYHDPKLFNFLNESEFPEALQQWVQPYKDSLLEVQEYVRQRVLKTPQNNTYTQASAYTSSDGWESYAPIIGIGIVIAILFGFCSQIPSTVSPSDASGGGIVETEQGTPGIIRVDSRGVYLRTTPNGQIVDTLHNGTRINVLGSNNNDHWHQVTTQDGRSGWVWAEFVQLAE